MKYEEIITKIERNLEVILDAYFKKEGRRCYRGEQISGYEMEEALSKIYDMEEFKFRATELNSFSLMCIDNLLLKVEYGENSKNVVEAITIVSPRRAEKILDNLINNKKPIEAEIETDENKASGE